MRTGVVCCLLLLLLAGCMPPLTADQARATAVVGGCWPYGYDQPVTPEPPGPVRNGTPTPVPPATVVAYAGCTTLPLTPTPTLRPTRIPVPVPPPTPPPPALLGGLTTIGQHPGLMTPWGRATRSPVLAMRPDDGRALVSWLSWGASSDVYAGDVWVRAQGPARKWLPSVTVNSQQVNSFFGGIGATWTVSDTLVVAYGGGGFAGDTRIYVASSADGGQLWGSGQPTGLRGRVVGVQSDARGGIYLLALTDGPTDAQSGYPTLAYWSPTTPTWRVVSRVLPYWVGGGDLQITGLPDGTTLISTLLTTYDPTRRSRVVAAQMIAERGQWAVQDLSDPAQLGPGVVVASSLVAARRPDGSVVLGAAWSQTPGPGPAAGAVQARVSRNGGQTWGPVAIIAQHDTQARFTDDPTQPAPVGGFEPAMVYDRATDSLALSWIEDDLSRTDDRIRSQTNRSVRTLLAVQRLALDGDGWLFTVLPEQVNGIPPQLTNWGQRGALWGSESGDWQWLTIIDERNRQSQLLTKPITLAALLAEGAP